MRVWDIHPGYLSNQSLLGEHSEIHALYSIIDNQKKGYARHPETKRWKGRLDLLVHRHNLLVKEMDLRDFRHNSPLSFSGITGENKLLNPIEYLDIPAVQFGILQKKYLEKQTLGRIPLPRVGTEFWAHHKYSIMARGYQYYKEIQRFVKNRLAILIVEENELIEKVQNDIKAEVSVKALDNVILHLWGYFKNKATEKEKETFFCLTNLSQKMKMLFGLSKKYQQYYLLHSTIFADFLPN